MTGRRKSGRRTFLRQTGLAAGAILGATPGLKPPPIPGPTAPRDPDFWRIVRANYPLTRERVYLNTGGLGPASHPVLQVMKERIDALQYMSETGHREIEAARAPVSAFFGAQPEEIAFLRNATEGNATIAAGLQLNPGDEVIFESHAHPGGAIPWMSRRKRDGIVIKVFVPDPESAEGNLQRIKDLITPRTRVIQISHVTAPTGIRMPARQIAKLAHEHEAWFHVDGAQSAGMIPVDVKEFDCDSYTTSGHKWLGAPHGTGLLYVKSNRLDDVYPTEVGAYSDSAYDLPDEFEYHASARRFEPGTRDASRVAGLVEAVRFMGDIGPDHVRDYSCGMAQYLHKAFAEMDGVSVLTPADPSLSGAITTIKCDQVRYDDLYRVLLSEHKLRCRIVTEEGLDALRISTHIFNSYDDCDRVIDGVKQAIAG